MTRQRGSVYPVTGGYGIRWTDRDGKRRHQSNFQTKTEARDWFATVVRPALHGTDQAATSPAIGTAAPTFGEYVVTFLARKEAVCAPRTIITLRERLMPAVTEFGELRLQQIRPDHVAAWASNLPTASARYRHLSALRQALAQAERFGFIQANPAKLAGPNPQPAAKAPFPFTQDEVDRIAAELGPVYGPMVVFAAESGLRTQELVGLHRSDIHHGTVSVERTVSRGREGPPKTKTARRAVPLTARAMRALEDLATRIDTMVLFPGDYGGYLRLDNWRSRDWTPALVAANVAPRGPY